MKNMKKKHLEKLIKTIGDVKLTEKEKSIIKWISENDPDTVNSICSIIEKVKKQKGV